MRTLTKVATAATVAIVCVATTAFGGRGASGEDDKFNGLPYEVPVFNFTKAEDATKTYTVELKDSFDPSQVQLPSGGLFRCGLQYDNQKVTEIHATSLLLAKSNSQESSVTFYGRVLVGDGTDVYDLATDLAIAPESGKVIKPDGCYYLGKTPLAHFQQEYKNNLAEIASRQNLLVGALRVASAGAFNDLAARSAARSQIDRLLKGYKLDIGLEPYEITDAGVLSLLPYAMSTELSSLVPELNNYRLIKGIADPNPDDIDNLIHRFQWDDLVALYRKAMENPSTSTAYQEARNSFFNIAQKYKFSVANLAQLPIRDVSKANGKWYVFEEYREQFATMATDLDLFGLTPFTEK
jgi:hypothetical protein